MGNNFFEGNLYNALSKIPQVIVGSVLFLFTSIPIFTIGASTMALYKSIVEVIQEDRVHFVKNYFIFFKESFVRSLPPAIIYLLYMVVIAMELSNAYLGHKDYFFSPYIWLVLSFVLVILGIVLYATMVVIKKPFMVSLRITMYIFGRGVKIPLSLFFVLLLTGICIYVVPALAWIAPGVVLFVAQFFVQPELVKFQDKMEKVRQELEGKETEDEDK